MGAINRSVRGVAAASLCAAMVFGGGVARAGDLVDQWINTTIHDTGQNEIANDTLQSHNQSSPQLGGGPLAPAGLAGAYYCESMRGRPCDTHTDLRLGENGRWGWGSASGQFAVNGGHLQFVAGSGGPMGWGSPAIGPGVLTFAGPVVWRKRTQ